MNEKIPTNNDTDFTQERLEHRYKFVVEYERNVEVRENIDIFNTPLLMRRNSDPFCYMEYERLGKMRAAGVTKEKVLGIPRANTDWFESDVLSFELPIPRINLYPGETFDEKSLVKIPEIKDELLAVNPNLSLESIDNLLERINEISYYLNRTRVDINKARIETDTKSRELIKDLLEDKEYLDVWLTVQRLTFGGSKEFEVLRKIGASSYTSQTETSRKGTFLVSPIKTELFSIAPHEKGGWMLEALGVSDIPISEIQGYIEMDEKDFYASKPLHDSLSEGRIQTIERINGSEYFKYIKRDIVSLVKELKSIDTELYKEILNLVKIDEDSLSDTETIRSLLCNRKGVLEVLLRATNIHITHRSYIRDLINNVPSAININNLSIEEVETKLYEHHLNKVKELFPFSEFSRQTFRQDIINAFCKYIVDKYRVDPNKITLQEFNEMLIKKMGIPIYDLKGNQLWPEQKPHEQLVEELKKKETRNVLR